jgi:hypothetical protein
MKPLILDDGRELSPSDTPSPCQATKDEDYYLSFVTFEVKGKSQSSSEEFSNTMIPFQVEDRLFRVPSHLFFNEYPDSCKIYKLPADEWRPD